MHRPAPFVRHTTLTVALALGVARCTTTPTEPASALAAARARWARNGPAAYSLTISRSCECLPETTGPVVVTVCNGAVVTRRYAQTGAAVAPAYAAAFSTVDGLFALVEAGVRNGTRPLDARYDATFGFPTRVVVGDPATDSPITSVTNFRPE